MEYNGKNSTSPLRYLFSQRAKWYNAFRNEDGTFQSDMFYETNVFEAVFFQRMNTRFETIIPKEKYIVQKNINGRQVEGLEFAVDALQGLITDLRNLVVAGTGDTTEDDPYLSDPIVYNSYYSPVNSYNNYINELMIEFFAFIKTNNLDNNITQISDFVKYFINFLNFKGPQFPATFTAWQKSRKSNIFSSGMSFGLAPLSCENDNDKENFINSPNFEAFKITAATNGFFIMANCPWIVMYSPNSNVGMNKYVKKYNDIKIQELSETDEETGITQTESTTDNIVNNSNTLTKKYFNTTYQDDINKLKKIYREYYNIFVNNNLYYKELIYKNKKTIQKIKYRSIVSLSNFNNTFDDLYWLLHYSDLRNIEEYNLHNQAEMDRIRQKTSFFEKKLDKTVALNYINDQYRFSQDFKSGGVNDYLRKQLILSEE